MAKKLSLLINTKNEQHTIKDCIVSAQKIVDEIVVADMGSTDDTKKIAKKLGAKVVEIRDFGYVEPGRQIGEKNTTGEWILVLDSDEQLTPELRKQIPRLLQQHHEVIAFPRKNVIFGQWMTGNDYWPNYQLRLYKRGAVHWPSTIHAGAVTQKPVYYLPEKEVNAFIHYVNVNPDYLLAKTDKYSTYDTSFYKYIAEHGFTADAVYNYLQHGFRYGFITKEGYKDGFGGFIMSKLMDIYRFGEVGKYWLKNGQPKMKNEAHFLEKLKLEQEYKESIFFQCWLIWRKLKQKLS